MRNGGIVRPHSIEEITVNEIKRVMTRNKDERRVSMQNRETARVDSIDEIEAKSDRKIRHDTSMDRFTCESHSVSRGEENDNESHYNIPVTTKRRRDSPAVQERTSTGWETGLAIAAGVVTAVGVTASLFLSGRNNSRR